MTRKETQNQLYAYFYGFSYILQYYLVFAGAFLMVMAPLNSAVGLTFGKWLYLVTGFIMILFAIAWAVYKRYSNNVTGEKTVDLEMQRQAELTKEAALDKLNIVSEQIESISPIVLCGVACLDAGSKRLPRFLRRNIIFLLITWVKFLLLMYAAILTLIIPSVVMMKKYSKISYYPGFGSSAASSAKGAWILPFLLFVVFIGAVSAALYFLLEKRCYVNPKKIKELDKRPPKMIRKYGSDDVVRVSLPSITVYMFSEEQLYVYTRYFDIITGNVFHESVDEYFYEDIVAVTSKQKTLTTFKSSGIGKLGWRLKSVDYLEESISVVTKGCTQTEDYLVDMGESLLDKEFMGMRNLIRQKKEMV